MCLPLRSRGEAETKKRRCPSVSPLIARCADARNQFCLSLQSFPTLFASPGRWQHLPVSMHCHYSAKFQSEVRKHISTAKTLWDRKPSPYMFSKNTQRVKYCLDLKKY
uniref:Uncharacterized protein n=1 Tax=Rhipicephalus zambeziensis TaxID=60191 RepID=A0A224YGJ9_9ACAR